MKIQATNNNSDSLHLTTFLLSKALFHADHFFVFTDEGGNYCYPFLQMRKGTQKD
jgi:hypothetical protein